MHERPEITVTAARSDQQPSAAGLFTMQMPLGKTGEVWFVTVTCPHGEYKRPFVVPDSADGPPTPERAQAVAEKACEDTRTEFWKLAKCPCAHPYWAQHGPFLATTVEGQATAIALHDEQPCRN